MSKRTWLLAGLLLQPLMVLATAFPWATHGLHLGEPTWHHNVSLVAVLALTAALWRPITQDRAFIGIGIMMTTVLALVSGFLILYLKQELKVWELKDWAKFWHVAWSWAALVWAVTHTAINWKPLRRMLARWHRSLGGYASYALPWLIIAILIPVTWSPLGARAFTEPNYILWTLWTWIVIAGVPYLAWIVHKVRLDAMRRVGPADGPLRRWGWTSRPATQSFVDVWLVPMTLLANLSGIPLLYFGTKDTSLKYVAKYWHTWPSIAMAVLVFVHSIQFWPGVRRHWAKLDAKNRA